MWVFVDDATGMDAYKLQAAELSEPAVVLVDGGDGERPGPGHPGDGRGDGVGGRGDFDILADMMRSHKRARTTQQRYEKERTARTKSLVQDW
eukprot:6728683-Pyramimonas_sp.AAC.1